MIKLSDYVVKFIEQLGVKHIFMISGGGCMHLVDSVGKSKKIQYVCNQNEQAVSICVEAYAECTNHIGVGIVTTGPGGTNAVTGVAAAYVDSIPCLIISGQVKTSDLAKNYGVRQMGYQEVDITNIVKPITKYAVMIERPEEIKYHLEKATYLALNGRKGPVWIDIPLDVQASMINEEELVGFVPPEEQQGERKRRLDKPVEDLIQLLNQARRPCILVGNGVRLANAKKQFLEIVEYLNIPVLSTWKVVDFMDEMDVCNYGRPGAIGQRAANFIQQNCDFLLVIGARLDLGQTAYNHQNFAPYATKVMIDIDEKEISKMNMPIAVKIAEDAKLVLEEILSRKEKIHISENSDWKDYCNRMRNQYPVIKPEYWEEKDYVNPYCFMEVLSESLSNEDVIVPGSSGSCSEITMQAFKVKKGQRLFNNEGFGSMGFGLPASISACLASGQRTICINGDGGFQFNIQELETLARHQLPIKIFIFNNQGYAAITGMQRNHFNSFYVASQKDSEVTLPDVCRQAEAYHIKSMRIHNNTELREKVREVLSNSEPVICDLCLNPEQPTMPKAISIKLPDGKMMSKPMEDLWPFLDREEFKENMIYRENRYETL